MLVRLGGYEHPIAHRDGGPHANLWEAGISLRDFS